MRLLIFSILLSVGALYAQNKDSLKTKKWAIGLGYSPDYCFRVPYTDEKSAPKSTSTEKAKLGITIGVNALYKVAKRLSIETAILYSTKGEKVYTPSLSWNTPGGAYDPTIPNYNSQGSYVTSPERNSTYTYQYLEIPLKINWYVLNKKFKLFPSIGCSGNIFLGKKTNTTFLYEDGHSEKEIAHDFNSSYIPKIDLAVLASVGLSYDVSKNIFIKLEPTYKQFIRPLVDVPVSGYFYSFGLNTGLYIRL
jgi:opacity protein-like surface antigen